MSTYTEREILLREAHTLLDRSEYLSPPQVIDLVSPHALPLLARLVVAVELAEVECSEARALVQETLMERDAAIVCADTAVRSAIALCFDQVVGS